MGIKKKYLTFIILAFFSIVNVGISAEEDFSIYLPKAAIPTREPRELANLIDLKKIELNKDPIVSERDIIAYHKASHTIDLTAEAIARIRELRWKVAIICIGRRPIYWGIILSGICQVGFDAVIILIPSPLEPDSQSIQINCGYPSREWFTGTDPRDSPEILGLLRKHGKLLE